MNRRHGERLFDAARVVDVDARPADLLSMKYRTVTTSLTEFIEAPFYLAPISVAVVAEDGREFYAVNRAHDPARADPWVVENVLAKLPPVGGPSWMSREQIAERLRAFAAGDERPEFWAYFADYDWVLFCWLHGGRMVDMPAHYPKFCMDVNLPRPEGRSF